MARGLLIAVGVAVAHLYNSSFVQMESFDSTSVDREKFCEANRTS